MNTNRFKITYKSGATEEVSTDAVDAADQTNRTFGLTPEEAAEFGVKVEMLGEFEPDVEAELQAAVADELVHEGIIPPDELAADAEEAPQDPA